MCLSIAVYLRIFHGIYRFLPVLIEISEKIHLFSFYTAFYAPIGVKNCVLSYEGKMRSDSILVGNLIDDLLEEFNLRIFHGIYRFLPVLTKISENIHFFSFYIAFYAPIGVKNCVFKV